MRDKYTNKFISDNITLESIYSIYNLDRFLKHIFSFVVEEIEIALRARLIDCLSKYGSDAIYKEECFSDRVNPKTNQTYHSEWFNNFNQNINKNNSLIVKHHIDTYGKFHIWAVIETCSFGSLSMLFSNLKSQDQKIIAKQFNTKPSYLRSWLSSLVEVRNIIAHYGRLYMQPLTKVPKLYNIDKALILNSPTCYIQQLFLVCRYIIPNKTTWNAFVSQFDKVFNEHHKDNICIDLKWYGFPEGFKISDLTISS